MIDIFHATGYIRCDSSAITPNIPLRVNGRMSFLILIDARSRTPIFEQIKNQIIELAITGVLKPHDQIPSIRSLSHDLKLNVNTVKRAFTELEQAGVIYTLTGRGSFVAETAVSNTQLKAKALEEIKIALKIGRANGIEKETVMHTVEDIYD